jgi:NitT/TauT family transport system permease protein
MTDLVSTQSSAQSEPADSRAADEFTRASPPPLPKKRRSWVGILLPPIAIFAVVIGIWYYISYRVMSPNRRRVALPPPHEVWTEGFMDSQAMSKIIDAMLVTGKVALIGLVIAAVWGIFIAVLMNQAKWVERSIFPYAVVIQTLPILALVPLIRNWFGTGINARVVACVLIAIFPVITNTLFGLQSVDRSHHELFTLHGTNRVTRLWKLELPAALPAIFTGLRIAAGGSVIGAIVGDFFFRQGEIGIGRLIDNYQKENRIPELFTAAIISSVFGIIIFVFFGMLANRVLRNWHESQAGNR